MAEVAPAQSVSSPCDIVRAEIGKYGDWDVNTMAAIAQAENTTCNETRHNMTASETHRDIRGEVVCVGSYGVLQVGCVHYGEGDDPNDLATNIRIAHTVWLKQGYRAWTQYSNGKYKEYLWE